MPSRSLLYAIFPLCHRLILQVSTICVSEVHQVETFFVAMTKLSGEGVLPLLRYVDHDPDTSRASPLHQYASLTVSESPDSTASTTCGTQNTLLSCRENRSSFSITNPVHRNCGLSLSWRTSLFFLIVLCFFLVLGNLGFVTTDLCSPRCYFLRRHTSSCILLPPVSDFVISPLMEF
jgi:hypothetical protein